MKKKEWMEKIRLNISVESVGHSTLMMQAGEGRLATSRAYLAEHVLLEKLKGFDEKKFQTWLNTHTDALASLLIIPDTEDHNWGAARKVLNIYLRKCAMNKDLNTYFKLEKVEGFLELPLDNPNARKIYEEKPGKFKITHFKIKTLSNKTEQDLKFYSLLQRLSQEIADDKKIHRYELDVLWWGQDD